MLIREFIKSGKDNNHEAQKDVHDYSVIPIYSKAIKTYK